MNRPYRPSVLRGCGVAFFVTGLCTTASFAQDGPKGALISLAGCCSGDIGAVTVQPWAWEGNTPAPRGSFSTAPQSPPGATDTFARVFGQVSEGPSEARIEGSVQTSWIVTLHNTSEGDCVLDLQGQGIYSRSLFVRAQVPTGGAYLSEAGAVVKGWAFARTQVPNYDPPMLFVFTTTDIGQTREAKFPDTGDEPDPVIRSGPTERITLAPGSSVLWSESALSHTRVVAKERGFAKGLLETRTATLISEVDSVGSGAGVARFPEGPGESSPRWVIWVRPVH